MNAPRTQSAPALSAADGGLLILLSVLWGGSFLFVEIALRGLPPLTLVCLRVALAAPVLLALCTVLGQRLPRQPRIWLAFAIMGLLNNVLPFSLIVWGQTHLSAGHASIFNATTPLFGVLLAHLATRDERLRSHRAMGVIIGFAGAVWVIGPRSIELDSANLLAPAAIIGASISYALAGVFARRFKAMGVTPMHTAAGAGHGPDRPRSAVDGSPHRRPDSRRFSATQGLTP